MDLIEVIRQLKTEKERLDRTIEALEAIWRAETGTDAPKRKGRKGMPDSEREQVSQRMKDYWAAWRRLRAQQPGKPKTKGAGGGSATDA